MGNKAQGSSRMAKLFALEVGEKYTFLATCQAQSLRVDIARRNSGTIEADRKKFKINETYDKGDRYITVTRILTRKVNQGV